MKTHRICMLTISLSLYTSYALADFQDKLPSSLTLIGGQSRTENAVANCTTWDCTFGYNGGIGDNFSISTSGNTNSSLTLNATYPTANLPNTIKFYINNASINPHSTLVLKNFGGFLLNGNMNLNNATLTFENPNGNASFQTSKQLTLANQSHLNITANSFLNNHQGTIEINHSTLSVNTTSGFNNQNNITNNHGTITITGSFYNIGQEIRNAGIGNPSSIATFINNGGSVTINGDFYNGGQRSAGTTCSIQGCGGGNLINYSGTITINGNLISEMKENQPSSVQIHGGTIKVSNMTNGAGSTLTFSAYNGQMGQLEGNVRNNGTIKADISGLTFGTHALITGTLSGTQVVEVLSGDEQNDFVTSSMTGGTLKLEKNEAAINAYLATLSTNQAHIITTLDTNNTTNIFTYGKNTQLNIVNSLIDTAQSMLLYALPMTIWSVRENTLTPLKRQIYPQSNINIAPFAAYASHGTLKSPLYGATISLQNKYKKHTLSGFVTYATSNATQSTTYSKINFNTNTFLIGIMDRIPLSSAEITLIGYYGLALSKNQRDFTTDNSALARFSTSYSYHEMGISALISKLIRTGGGALHIKPFVGFEYTLGKQNDFHEASTSHSSSFSASSYLSHLPQIIAGAQIQYFLTRWQAISLNTQMQCSLMKAPTHSINFDSRHLQFAPHYGLAYTLDLGYSVYIKTYIKKRLSINIHALYDHSTMGFQAYSGIANLSYHF